MAWLFVDTHAPGTFRVGWLDPTPAVKSFEGRAHRVLEHLGPIRRLRARCTGICVVKGPGSFSSVRIGVLIANMLSRLLSVPLVGVSAKEADDLDGLISKLRASRVTRHAYVAPVYDAEPNITFPRS